MIRFATAPCPKCRGLGTWWQWDGKSLTRPQGYTVECERCDGTGIDTGMPRLGAIPSRGDSSREEK